MQLREGFFLFMEKTWELPVIQKKIVGREKIYCVSLGHLVFYVTKLKAMGNELFMSLSIVYMDHVC